MSVHYVIRLSARTVRPQLHRADITSRSAVHKALSPKMKAYLRAQWCKDHQHWPIGMCNMIRWVIYHHILHKWASACLAYNKRTVQVWMLDPFSEGLLWICYAAGGILLAWFGSPQREGSLQINTKLFWAVTPERVSKCVGWLLHTPHTQTHRKM